MNLKKININKALAFFLFLHLIVWTLVPSLSNQNLPLDTIEALAWSTNLDWGYGKHPPFSAWAVGFIYDIFKNQDWAYYFLSQIFVITAFYVIFKFSEDFFKKKIFCLISILLLEGIYFYNFTTPEFNVNVCQLPFWALTVYYLWEGIKNNNSIHWLLFGFFAALGVLSKYLFIYLLVSIDIFFIYLLLNKKFDYKCLVSLISFFLVISLHLVWLANNDYTTITYAMHRTGIENSDFIDAHLLNPIVFLGKQIGILSPFFIMFFVMISKLKAKIDYKNKKLVFLLIINIFPIILMFLTSLLFGIKIRTMWMTPFYLFIGVLFIYVFQKEVAIKKIKYFVLTFFIFFILSPITYLYISLNETNKRTDYPGKKISKIVQQKWENNFVNEIGLVAGDEWHGGNLSYHISPRPKWDNILEEKKTISLEKIDGGFVIIGEKTALKKICSGVFFEVENQGICMVGKVK